MRTVKFKSSEVGPIPVEWEVKRLGELFSFKNGYNTDAKNYGRGVPVASVLEALADRPLKAPKIRGKVIAPQKDQDSFSLKRGDLIFTRSSETLEDVGRSNVYDDDAPAMFGGFVIRGRPKTENNSACINLILKTQEHRDRVMSQGAGAQHYNIGQSGLERVLVALPPRREQEKIAEALTDVDELLAAMTTLIEKKRAIKQGAMQQLLTGKKRLAGFTGPWVEKRLGDCGYLVKETVNPSDEPERLYFEFSMPAFDDGRQARRVYGKAMLSSRTAIKGRVLLFNKLNVRQRRIWHIKECPENAVCSSEFLPFYSIELDLSFLSYILDTEECVQSFIDRSKGTSNSQKRIAPSDFEGYVIVLPPSLAEQQAIAAVLSDMDAEIAALESKRAKYESVKQGMMQELLTGKVRLG